MKILDRYIIKQFLLTALFGIVAFTIIFVVIDLMEKLDDFLDRSAGAMVIVQYYVAFTPEMIKLMTPVAILLSSLFTTGKMSNNNELTAMKSSGVSMYRFMAPMMILALFISVVSVYFNGWIVPFANQHKSAIERRYLERNFETTARSNIYVQDGPQRIVYISYFDRASNSGGRSSIQDFSDSNLISMAKRVDAREIHWDSLSGKWTLLGATVREFDHGKETMSMADRFTVDTLHFVPSDIIKKEEKPDEMNYFELKKFIERQQRTGNDVARWQVDFYSKVSFPFASFIVVLFGVPFSFGKRRGGLAVQFGISVAVCFIYLIFMKTSQVFGYNGDLEPLLTAWLANLVFLFGGIANIIRVQK
ncbi:MAG TPA: LPS export ABC transporter permease LptG [Bacteroidota bacterium]|nr:LPS export ABC transporter permease LptG [Bacteroidota bacterium]